MEKRRRVGVVTQEWHLGLKGACLPYNALLALYFTLE
jgi:hypothetical protein